MTPIDFDRLDSQLSRWNARLTEDVHLDVTAVDCIATTMAREVRELPYADRVELAHTATIDLQARFDELLAFQGFMDYCSLEQRPPYIVRAQLILQNYICFLYLPESYFRDLKKRTAKKSSVNKCTTFLTNNPIRALRNSIAHANWKYNEGYTGLVYWAKKGGTKEEPMHKFEVDQETLDFWQQLARAVAYSTISVLMHDM